MKIYVRQVHALLSMAKRVWSQEHIQTQDVMIKANELSAVKWVKRDELLMDVSINLQLSK